MSHDRLIRSATVADAADLLEIYSPIVRDTAISFELQPPPVDDFADRIHQTTTDPWLVMERDGVIAGYAYASEFRARPAYRRTRETTVYVHADHRRAGVARELLSALLNEITVRGARTAVAGIALPNDPSIALHEAFGFGHVGTFHDVGHKFDQWHDVGFWELLLPALRDR